MSFILAYHPSCNPFCTACSHKSFTLALSRNYKLSYLSKVLNISSNILNNLQFYDASTYSLEYRKRVLLHAHNHNNKWLFGLMHRNKIIPIHHCPLHDKYVNEIICRLQPLLTSFEFFPLKFISINYNHLTFILKAKSFAIPNSLLIDIIDSLQSLPLCGIHLHFFPSCGKKIFGEGPLITIWGTQSSQDTFGFWYNSRTFMQPILPLAHRAYLYALSFLREEENFLLDLYCGRGIFSALFVTENSLGACGVDVDRYSIEMAKKNAPNKCLFLLGSIQTRIPQLNEIILIYNNSNIVLFANPTRKGIGSNICQSINDSIKPKKIAYMSCNPLSLKEDLTILTKNYRISQIIPFDFFPWTHHIECLVLLERVY